MSRLVAGLCFALAVILSTAFFAPQSFEAEAAKKPKNKQCIATQMDGKKSRFVCKANETCCFDSMTNTGTCVPAGNVCM